MNYYTNIRITVFLIFLSAQPFLQQQVLRAQSISRDEQNALAEQGYRFSADYKLPEEPILSDYEKAVLSQNPAIRAAYGEWQAEVKKIAMMHGMPDPKINFGYFIQNIETAVGPQQWKIGIMQMVPWLGKLIVQGDIQTHKAEAAFQRLQSVIDAHLMQLRLLYYDNYYLERSIAITEQNIVLVKNWERVILNKYKTDMARHSNLIKTQIESIKLEDDLETLKAKRDPLIESVRALMNTRIMSVIRSPDSLVYQPLAYTKEEMEGIVMENNPGLKTTNLLSRAAGKSVTRAKMNFLPDFSIGVDYIRTGDKFMAPGEPVPESGKDPLVIMGSVSIPLWFYKHAAGVGMARHQERKAQAQVKEKENSLQAEFESIWFDLNDAERKIKLYRDVLIPKSLESLRVSEKAYASDEADFLNIIDAQRRFLQFQLAYEMAMVRYHKTRARLEALAGRTL